MARRQRRQDELAAITDEHLNYEIQMVLALARALEWAATWSADEQEGRWAVRNALIESFTIH